MAGTTRSVKAWFSKHTSSGIEDGQRALTEEFNKVVADLEVLRAAIDTIADKLDAENVTNLDTDYATNAGVATAAVLTAGLVSTVETGSP
jgi:Skp family chaperone for outer membrane proteins